MWPENSSFSSKLPTLQVALDSTSLGALKKCPRFYELSIVRGWSGRKRSVDLEFGIWLHSARELYYRLRAGGAEHEAALLAALNYAMTETWDKELDRPWQGDQYKNRFTLARTLVWYLDQWGNGNDPLETIILADGKPAVEVSFRFPLGFSSTSTHDEYTLCGHLDRLVQYNGRSWISDLKSTKHTLDAHYFSQFTPDNQMTCYALGGQVTLGEAPSGIIIDAVQIGVGFSRFTRGMVMRTSAQIDEWMRGLRVLLAQAEGYARDNFWPMNEKACFGCAFRGICSHSPQVRERWLEADFVKRVWDPLQVRGDI